MVGKIDAEERARKLAILNKDVRLCNFCSYPLLNPTEKMIGLHTWCLADSKRKLKTAVQGPRYGKVDE
ncbi:MAG: hypothetical protein C5B59_17210 [Bacteroidetes bacterium]|nr:MAG: hypothetical protein C5B59_17210 [Bacteroidota bacterium]